METKFCRKCQTEKPVDSFSKNKRNEDGRQKYCKTCHSSYDKKCYDKNIESFRKRSSESRKRTLNEFREIKKNLKCAKCNDTRYYVLDFHHKNPAEKDNVISKVLTQKGLKQAKKEIEKCIALCSNCHREFHHLEREQNMTIREYLSNGSMV